MRYIPKIFPKSLILCSSCGRAKPLGWFRRAGLTAAGTVRRSKTCRECRRGSDSAHAARRRAAVGRHGKADIDWLMRAQGWRCACGCGRSLEGGMFHVDHRVPLARGGTNWGPVSGAACGQPGNLQLLAPRCNLRKGAR
jgi:5-methylcytosine-specific restriction endonuclease McrA